jgi:hypothetical protein
MLYNFHVYPTLAFRRSDQIPLNQAKQLIGVEPNLHPDEMKRKRNFQQLASNMIYSAKKEEIYDLNELTLALINSHCLMAKCHGR